jgi:hypothetical protein
MASSTSPSIEVILYPTRATRSTTEFSREALWSSYALPPRPEAKVGKFRVSVTWGNEEAFTISNLGRGGRTASGRVRVAKETAARL